MSSVPPGADSAPALGDTRTASDPFRVLGIVGFVLSFFAIANIAGLVLSVIALFRSARAGYRNRFALAGTIISALGVLVTIAIVVAIVTTLVDAAQTCAELGTGVHVIGNATYTCTPTSFFVSYGK